MFSDQSFVKLRHSIYSLNSHLVLVTKYRRPAINSDILARLEQISSRRATNWGGSLREFNGEADHIHLLLSLPPTLDLSKFVNCLKTTSSRIIRREFPEHLSRFYWKPVFWSRSCCIVSCGGAPLSVVKQYVQNQDNPE
ncbi:IS200/IS605 family transposase [Salipiger mucosus]|uniref:IS200/IS605 family transposase n=1 Tax=Salipiger mucosus TaxID=263378 RepID=UPI000A029A0F